MNHEERRKRRKEIAEMVHQGASLRETAIYFDVSTTMVRECHRLFYPDEAKPKKDLPRASKTVRIVAELLRSNDSLSAISNRVGTTYQNVQSIAAQLQAEHIPRPGAS